jgi:hypothetical protein
MERWYICPQISDEFGWNWLESSEPNSIRRIKTWLVTNWAPFTRERSHVVKKRVGFLLRIFFVPGSAIGFDTNYTGCSSSWSVSAPPDKYRDNSFYLATITSQHVLSN